MSTARNRESRIVGVIVGHAGLGAEALDRILPEGIALHACRHLPSISAISEQKSDATCA